jgi:hypothetical protein
LEDIMAAGDTLAVWGALGGAPPATGFATLDVRNGHAVLDFDADADEAMVFAGLYPAIYAGGDLSVDLYWAATSATSGNVKWLAALERTSAGDLDADSFGTASTATAATSATNGGVTKTSLSVSSANAGSPQASDAFRLKVSRDADDAGDTLTGDAELLAVHVREA